MYKTKKPRFTFINPESSKGFSLLEVCLALTLLVLISGSVYAVLRGSLDMVSSLRENVARRQEVEGFLDLCARTFRKLPSSAGMECRFREQAGRTLPVLIFRDAPQLFSWGIVEDLEVTSILGLKSEDGGRFSIALLRIHQGKDRVEDPTVGAVTGDWLTLVPNVKNLSWRFYDKGSHKWLDFLPATQARPWAVELTLELADESAPFHAVFEVNPPASDLKFYSSQSGASL